MTRPGSTVGSAVAALTVLTIASACGSATDVRNSAAVADPASSGSESGSTSWSPLTAVAPTAPPGASASPSASAPSSGRTAPGRVARTSMRALPRPSAATLRAGRSRPVEDPYYPSTSNPEVDALHYALGLVWDGTTLYGDTALVFRAASTTHRVRLDLSTALTVTSTRLDGDRIRSRSTADDGLVLTTGPLRAGSLHTVEIAYNGSPHSTPAPSLRSDMAEGLGWNVDSDGSVHTFQEPYGAFTWYPVNDEPSDKALYDAAITTSADNVAVFNGTQLPSVHNGRQTTSRWHLDAPAASYLTTLAIGPYQRFVGNAASGMHISYWLEPRDDQLLPGLRRQGRLAFNWLRTHAGRYPFSSLGVVVVGGDSAMETQTMITMSRSAARRPDAVLEHEMAHQWFGDSLTPRTWQGVWLNEGWATYMQQWYEQDTRRVVYGGAIRQWRHADQESRDRSGPPGDYEPQSFADVNVYFGPAMMLDAIRQRIGNRAFDAIVKAWPAEHRHSTVDRAIFTRWLKRQSGVDFTALIHRWLDSARTPRLP